MSGSTLIRCRTSGDGVTTRGAKVAEGWERGKSLGFLGATLPRLASCLV